jgi:hypothetical protein
MSEESSKKKSDFKQILAGVSELSKQQIIDVFIPSINDTISFKPLTVKQQKLILSSGVDTEIENLSFSNAMNDIIIENCLSSANKIKTIDKPLILLQLRRKAVGNTLTITSGEDIYKIDIDEHVKNITEQATDATKTKFKLNVEGVEIQGEIPDLKTDTNYNKQFTKKIKSANKNKLNLTDVVGDIYIHEMVKYVKSISIGDNILEVDDNVTIGQVISVFESLPMKISNEIAENIKKLRKIEIASLSNDVLPEDVQISLDASIFTND